MDSFRFPAGPTPVRFAPALLTVLLSITGCSTLIGTAEYPFRQIATFIEDETGEEKPRLTLVQLENQLMRFADNFAQGSSRATDRLRENGQPPDAMRLLKLKLEMSEDAYQVATGPNPYANLLDMMTLVSLLRSQIEVYWMPDLWGYSAAPLLDVMRQNEQVIWALGKDVLRPDMQVELRRAINRWASANGKLKSLGELRATGFATAIARYAKGTGDQSDDSVFDLLQIDPLSSLDPATKEIARTRHMAERALFIAQRTPTLLRWQMELLILAASRNPGIDKVVAASSRVGDAANMLGQVAGRLPDDIARERQAILRAVQSQTGPLTGMAVQIRGALEAGHAMAASTDDTLKTLSTFHASLNRGPTDPRAKPFDIDDYKGVAREVADTATQLNQMLGSLEQIGGGTGAGSGLLALGDALETRGDHLIRQLMRTGLILIGCACLGLFLTLLAYRMIAIRLERAGTRALIAPVNRE